MKTVSFSSLPVNAEFVGIKTGWTMKKLANAHNGAGRAEFGEGSPSDIFGKVCSIAQTKKVYVK